MTGAGVPILIVPGRERHHEVTMHIWAVLLGALYMFGAPRPTSMVGVVHGPAFYTFAAGLLLGGVLGLAGSFWMSNVERGLELERAGLIALSGALLVFVVAAFVYAGLGAMFAGGMCAAWVYANVYRSVGITRDLALLRGARPPRPVA